jgi:hypothetical protein
MFGPSLADLLVLGLLDFRTLDSISVILGGEPMFVAAVESQLFLLAGLLLARKPAENGRSGRGLIWCGVLVAIFWFPAPMII